MLDFEVYYRSAFRLLQGENLYRIESDGYYIFKYSPVSALPYIPFTAFPLVVAKNLYWFFLTLVAASSFYLCFRLAMPEWFQSAKSRIILYMILLMLATGVHLYREFAIGQVNMVLFLSYLLIIRLYQLQKPIPVALILAIGIFFKPWGLIFIPFFLINKKYRVVLYFFLFSILLFLLPVFFYGYQGLLEQTAKWFNEMAIEMGYKQDLGALSNFTIFSVLYRYTPVQWIGSSAGFQLIFQIIVLLLLALLTFLFIRRSDGIDRKEVAEGALLMALMPLIAPANYNTFLLLGLAIVLLMVHFKELPLWVKILFVVGVVLQGGNFNDLWGTDLSNRLLEFSVVTIGALLILFSLFFIRFKKIA